MHAKNKKDVPSKNAPHKNCPLEKTNKNKHGQPSKDNFKARGKISSTEILSRRNIPLPLAPPQMTVCIKI